MTRSEASATREHPQKPEVYFARIGGGIWRQPVEGGEESRLIEDFPFSLPGYWAVFSDGIYYVSRRIADRSTHVLKFFDFRHQQTVELGTLPGTIEEWVGGLTVSSDRRTILYSQLTYESREVMVVDRFR